MECKDCGTEMIGDDYDVDHHKVKRHYFCPDCNSTNTAIYYSDDSDGFDYTCSKCSSDMENFEDVFEDNVVERNYKCNDCENIYTQVYKYNPTQGGHYESQDERTI